MKKQTFNFLDIRVFLCEPNPLFSATLGLTLQGSFLTFYIYNFFGGKFSIPKIILYQKKKILAQNHRQKNLFQGWFKWNCLRLIFRSLSSLSNFGFLPTILVHASSLVLCYLAFNFAEKKVSVAKSPYSCIPRRAKTQLPSTSCKDDSHTTHRYAIWY